MNGLITVIIPVYNAEKYLNRCLTSVTGQTYTNLEILLVDDGSVDNSAGIIREWCGKDSRIRLLQQENQGVSAARNLGLEQAQGEYVTFVDADDWILPGMLEKQRNCLCREGSDMVLCGFRVVTDSDVLSAEQEFQKEAAAHNGRKKSSAAQAPSKVLTVNAKTYAGEYLLLGHNRCWSVLFKRNLVENTRFVRGLTIGEDMLFMLDLLPRLKMVSVMEDKDYCYFINENGAMLAEFREKYMDQIICWQLAQERMDQLWPEFTPLIQVCLFQAALLVAGKLALLPEIRNDKVANYLERCHKAACSAWESLGKDGRRRLSGGYRIKGLIFLRKPWLYLRLYHLWKGLR